MTKDATVAKPIHVIIPFEEFDPSLLESVRRSEQELKELRCSLVVVDHFQHELTLDLPVIRFENPEKLGFIRAANLALKKTVEDGADVVLMDPATAVYPGTLREMQRVADLDSMIGFVSPRSNDSAIGAFPRQQEFQEIPSGRAYAIFTELSRYLPAFWYAPFASKRCVFIKLEILKEFGLFDETCEQDHDAVNDLVMRANRCGYRAALANHAFVFHNSPDSGSPPGCTDKQRYSALLASRYPEYTRHASAHVDSAPYQSEVLLAGLLKQAGGRYDIVFDCSNFGTYHNGTFEAAKQIITRAAADWTNMFNIHVLVEDEAARFHGIHLIPGLTLITTNANRVFALAIRIGQPFQSEAILRMSRLAVLNVYSMLDPIAWDCLYLQSDELGEAWRAVFLYADAILYLSDFVANQFHLRFQRRAGMRELVSYPSLDTRDYADAPELHSATDHLLVMGNSFAHKNVEPTVATLSREFPHQKIIALGLDQSTSPNVVAYPGGHLSNRQLHKLFLDARAVVFPSFYEGFGLPILRSLACHKPVLARSTEVNRDLYERLGRPDDLILYESSEHLVQLLKQGGPTWKGSASFVAPKHDWTSAAQEIGEFIRGLINDISCADVLIPRLNYMNLLGRASEFGRLNREIDGSLAQRDAKIRELETKVVDLQAAVHDREQRVQDVFSSFSWAITAPLRRVGSVWCRLLGDRMRKRSSGTVT